ncbi:MAG: gamma-glutamyl-gamma-aminobutyrate hydrolase family protein, partial [Methylotenera sp.]|nr:gamma-glutamyl-gamma-aminobutyrate hydrolase family protein [Methylotenera sp.]
PAVSDYLEIESLLDIADGILLTGSVSNLHPSHFGQAVLDPSLPLDPARDALTLKLIHSAIKKRVPLLAICRGFQEINVAFGGSLHQAVHQVAGFNDHREAKDADINAQYAPAHEVRLTQGGKLAKIVQANTMQVNSIHGQGIDRLGAGLRAEAIAPDGLIEAISVNETQSFVLGVQWHPEWKVMENPQYLAIFEAFGAACKLRMRRHEPPD